MSKGKNVLFGYDELDVDMLGNLLGNMLGSTNLTVMCLSNILLYLR